MSYMALYRKFRPGEFSEVKGQEHIVTALRNQVRNDRIGHAYLFCGTRGTGKTTVAKILAKAVNCEHPVDGSPCEECDMCQRINAQTSMNVIEIDAASNTGVGNIRDIIEEVQYSPSEGRFKVYIIDEVHMLSIGAFNALLKTLEEPPSYVIFILATTEAHKIPITILSRCQRYDFKRISIDTIAERLRELLDREQLQAEEKAVRYIAKAADGSMRDALSLLDQCLAFYMGQELTYDKVLDVLGAVDTEVYSRMFREINAHNAVGCVELIDEMMMAGRDLNQFINEFVWYLRGLMLLDASDQGGDMLDVSTERLAQMKEEAQSADIDQLIRYIYILSDLSAQLRYATQGRVLAEVAIIKLCRPQMDTEQDLTTILGRLDQLEKQIEVGIPAAPVADDGGQASTTATQELSEIKENTVKAETKILPKAIPEEIRQIIERWDGILRHCDRMVQNMLAGAKKLVGEDGVLILQFTDPIDAGYFQQNDGKQLEAFRIVIQNTTGRDVPIQIRIVDERTDSQFADLSELIHFEDIKKVEE